MAQGFYVWSQTADSNGNSDGTVFMAEGMYPSQVNNGIRAAMARLREYGNDIAGAIVSAGSSTAYTVASNQVFDTPANLSGQIIAFTPHATNAAGPVTLNVDGIGAFALRSSPNTELLAGVLVQGTPYTALFNSSDGAFYLQGFYGANPYLIPLGGSIDYWLPTAPNSSFVMMFGQAISRVTYATLFTAMGTTFGTGDGSTTFNIPDARGRVVAGADNMGGTDANRLTTATMTGVGIGSTGGAETKTLVTANLPPYTPAGTVAVSVTTPTGQSNDLQGGGGNYTDIVANGSGNQANNINITTGASGTFAGTAQGGTSAPLGIVQPTILANRIMRII